MTDYDVKFSKIYTLLSFIVVFGSGGGENDDLAVSTEACNTALGMEEGRIPDTAITASSSYEPKSVGPQNARVRQEKNGGAWCPKAQISSKVREYLEIDLAEPHLITHTETQGRFGNGQGQEYAEQFAIEYWREPLKNWVVYKNHHGDKLLSANTNTYVEVKQRLELPFVASKIRFVPFSEHPRTVCMRVEIYGCAWQQNLVGYSAPRADTEFDDVSYDGVMDDKIMRDGLGQLVDNVYGDEDFLNHNQQTGNKKWVGWFDDSGNFSAGNPLEIVFEFRNYQQIVAICLHTSHFKTRQVQVFSQAEVFGSVDGLRFYQHSVKIKPAPARLRDGTHNVTLYADVKIAKFVKLKLHFAARWMLISEVRFDSKTVDTNKTEQLLLQYGSLVDSGVQPRQSVEEKDGASDNTGGSVVGRGLKINFINTEAYVVGLTILLVLLLIASTFGATTLLLKKNRREKLMRKHAAAVLSTSPTTFSTTPTLKELDITSTIGGNNVAEMGNGGVARYRQWRIRDHAKSAANIYSNIDGSLAVVEDTEASSDTSSLYYEPYKRIAPSSKYEGYTRTKGRETRDASAPNLRDDTKYSSISLYNLSSAQFPPPTTIYHPTSYCEDSVSDRVDTRYISTDDCVRRRSAEQRLTLGKFTPLKLPVGEKDENLHERNGDRGPPLLEFSRHRLRVIEKLGEGSFGMIHLCETEFTSDTYGHTVYHKNRVIVKSMRRGISEETRDEFFHECNQLATIRDPNIAKVIGVCSKDDPVSALQEYSEFGDLTKFLNSPMEGQNAILQTNFLLYLAAQIASAMKYLESRKIVHRDLAARNCMVGKNYSIKVSDHAIYCSQFDGDYYVTDKKSRLPVRWMSWESVLLGNYSARSDVWSFAVTLWEILMLCQQRPFAEYTDEQIIENCGNYYRSYDKIKCLHRPDSCPKDIYELMKECWRRNNIERPSFTEIHFFLQRKILGFEPPSES